MTKQASKTIAKLAGLFIASSSVAGCAGSTGPSAYANPPGTTYRNQAPLMTASPQAQRPVSPYAGQVIDSSYVEVPVCDTRTGGVYRVQFQKVINLNGQIDSVEVPRSRQIGFQETVDPASCAFINTMAGISRAGYRAPGGSNYDGTFNNVPVIRPY